MAEHAKGPGNPDAYETRRKKAVDVNPQIETTPHLLGAPSPLRQRTIPFASTHTFGTVGIVATTRRYRTEKFWESRQILAAADPLPEQLHVQGGRADVMPIYHDVEAARQVLHDDAS
jgi:hypothetical protein